MIMTCVFGLNLLLNNKIKGVNYKRLNKCIIYRAQGGHYKLRQIVVLAV